MERCIAGQFISIANRATDDVSGCIGCRIERGNRESSMVGRYGKASDDAAVEQGLAADCYACNSVCSIESKAASFDQLIGIRCGSIQQTGFENRHLWRCSVQAGNCHAVVLTTDHDRERSSRFVPVPVADRIAE